MNWLIISRAIQGMGGGGRSCSIHDSGPYSFGTFSRHISNGADHYCRYLQPRRVSFVALLGY
jgi:hypothetical protein